MITFFEFKKIPCRIKSFNEIVESVGNFIKDDLWIDTRLDNYQVDIKNIEDYCSENELPTYFNPTEGTLTIDLSFKIGIEKKEEE